jgi:hypothetical protein
MESLTYKIMIWSSVASTVATLFALVVFVFREIIK